MIQKVMFHIVADRSMDATRLSSGAGITSLATAACRSLPFVVLTALFLLHGNPETAALAQSRVIERGQEDRAGFAYSADMKTSDDKTLIIFKFDGKPDFRVFFMENPDRMVVELDGADFRFDRHGSDEAVGLISSWRSGNITAKKARMVLSLSQPIALVSKELSKSEDSQRHTLSLMLEAIDRETFEKNIRQQKELLGSSGESVIKGGRVRAQKKKEGHFRIVLDPGHGGIDGGATGVQTNVLEKDLVLSMAKKLGALIEKSGPFEVLFTRREDVFVSLRERQKFTRRSNADLLISLHADSLKQDYVRGATIYTLAKKASDSLSRQLAESENLSDVVAGLAAPEAKDDVTDILADLTLRETTRFSRTFSALLVNRLHNKIKLINNPRRSASFMVLKIAESPGVLVELGYLSNREDEEKLSDPQWQDKVVALMAETVREFFHGRQPFSGAK